MPCYDKMLEATRNDFVIQPESHDERSGNEDNMVTEIDSVLTIGEVLELIQFLVFVKKFRCNALSCRLTNINEEGYLLRGLQIDGLLNFINILNLDFHEVTLEASSCENFSIELFYARVEEKTMLRSDLYYDFWNLQNGVRKLKTGKCDYHFLKIMAYPSSCLNSGGQIKPKKGKSPEELSHLLETIYMENKINKNN
ncbi:hypothetical protein Ahy_B06g081701 [Arachis hypogaea]|uniref:Iron hydrogenase large subunit C-terminal domain-containing protein n=1 Tax=Arachis hypogaea TaxID=3818 RepID=A0A444YLS3_ARAHY|nr:hypothetical protein Ahy_B06g081701 [Arachis hypogaea]